MLRLQFTSKSRRKYKVPLLNISQYGVAFRVTVPFWFCHQWYNLKGIISKTMPYKILLKLLFCICKYSHYKFPRTFFLKQMSANTLTLSFSLKVGIYTWPEDVQVFTLDQFAGICTWRKKKSPAYYAVLLYKILSSHVFLTHCVHVSVVSLLEPFVWKVQCSLLPYLYSVPLLGSTTNYDINYYIILSHSSQ
jgi:hypothetical protein